MAELRAFWAKNELRITVFAAFLLSGGICFALGFLEGRKMPSEPLVIEKREQTAAPAQNTPPEPPGPFKDSAAPSSSSAASSSGCAFVGSRNSDKFYIPSCSWAKRIKPENLVCYKSEQEALAKGKAKSECP
ncbi:MAG TPA: hypothetical protein PKA31_02745 [Candidatus Moranbacteria bacterium]|nr:hypothetical protein [Candidatus Moranbacteria bacterium]